jgi:hypothetical protein
MAPVSQVQASCRHYERLPEANPPDYSKQRDYSYSVILFATTATVSERDEFIGIATDPSGIAVRKFNSNVSQGGSHSTLTWHKVIAVKDLAGVPQLYRSVGILDSKDSDAEQMQGRYSRVETILILLLRGVPSDIEKTEAIREVVQSRLLLF